MKKRFEKKQAKANPPVTVDVVAEVVSAWTKVPVSKLAESDAQRLKNLEHVLQKRVIGQDEAIGAVARAVKRGRVGLKDPKRRSVPSCSSGQPVLVRQNYRKHWQKRYLGKKMQ